MAAYRRAARLFGCAASISLSALYLSFTRAGVRTAAGHVHRHGRQIARQDRGAAVILAAAGVPTYLFQRGPYAKAYMDYSAVADVIDCWPRHPATA